MPRHISMDAEVRNATRVLGQHQRKHKDKPPTFHLTVNYLKTMLDAKRQGLPITAGNAIPTDELMIHKEPVARVTRQPTYQERYNQVTIMINRQLKRLASLKKRGDISTKQFNEYSAYFWKYYLIAKAGVEAEGVARNHVRANSFADLLRHSIISHPTYKAYYSGLVGEGQIDISKRKPRGQSIRKVAGQTKKIKITQRMKTAEIEELTAGEVTNLFIDAKENNASFELLTKKTRSIQKKLFAKYGQGLTETEAQTACLTGLWMAVRNLHTPFKKSGEAAAYIYRSMEGTLKNQKRQHRMKESHYEDLPSTKRKVTGEYESKY